MGSIYSTCLCRAVCARHSLFPKQQTIKPELLDVLDRLPEDHDDLRDLAFHRTRVLGAVLDQLLAEHLFPLTEQDDLSLVRQNAGVASFPLQVEHLGTDLLEIRAIRTVERDPHNSVRESELFVLPMRVIDVVVREGMEEHLHAPTSVLTGEIERGDPALLFRLVLHHRRNDEDHGFQGPPFRGMEPSASFGDAVTTGVGVLDREIVEQIAETHGASSCLGEFPQPFARETGQFSRRIEASREVYIRRENCVGRLKRTIDDYSTKRHFCQVCKVHEIIQKKAVFLPFFHRLFLLYYFHYESHTSKTSSYRPHDPRWVWSC